MENGDQYEKLFSRLDAPEPPAGLGKAILLRIERRERRMIILKAAVAAILFVVSVWVIKAGSASLMAGFERSGFLTLASLAFSDFSIVFSNLPDFLLSVIESFPVFSAAAVLGGVVFAIWSIGLFISEASLMRGHKFSLLKQFHS